MRIGAGCERTRVVLLERRQFEVHSEFLKHLRGVDFNERSSGARLYVSQLYKYHVCAKLFRNHLKLRTLAGIRKQRKHETGLKAAAELQIQ